MIGCANNHAQGTDYTQFNNDAIHIIVHQNLGISAARPYSPADEQVFMLINVS